jgi:hypothetical protein
MPDPHSFDSARRGVSGPGAFAASEEEIEA